MSSPLLLEQRHRFRRDEYDRIARAGGFDDHKVELIDGEVIDKLPQDSRHATAIQLVPRALERAFGPGFCLRIQLPLALGEYSEPEPDVAVVAGAPRDHRSAHPTSALLVVEVADSRLAYDLEVKSRLYAGAGIPEYWVLDVSAGLLHVHRDPRAGSGGADVGYRQVFRLGPGERLAPLAAPGAAIEVDDLLP